MAISVDSLAGYILEELIAYLIRNTGYRLLVDESQDRHELKNESNGLNIIGRGALHQVDVLGELTWIPAFTFPLRLVIEAKCRKDKVGIDVSRGMMALLTDVNQNQSHIRLSDPGVLPRPKYTYVGAVFSASGFSDRAADLALAHGVSLVDLNANEFKPLVDAARNSAATLLESAETDGYAASGTGFVRSVRVTLRQRLGMVLPYGVPTVILSPRQEEHLNPGLAEAVGAAEAVGELFVGMASGPYLILLKADDRSQFIRYATERPTHPISIHWSRRIDEGQTWSIEPRAAPGGYRLSFRLPERIGDWIFRSADARVTALQVKQDFFSTISIYRREDNRDFLVRLEYSPEQTRGSR